MVVLLVVRGVAGWPLPWPIAVVLALHQTTNLAATSDNVSQCRPHGVWSSPRGRPWIGEVRMGMAATGMGVAGMGVVSQCSKLIATGVILARCRVGLLQAGLLCH